MYEISKENFENLDIKGCFERLNDEIECLEKMEVNNRVYSIDYFVGNDLKMLYHEAGLKGATSNYSYPWCKCHKNDFWDASKEWSIIDERKVQGIMKYKNIINKEDSSLTLYSRFNAYVF